MAWFKDYMPVAAMIALQCTYAGLTLFTRAAMLQGMSPRVFVVYRQAIGALTMAPIVYFTRRNPYRTKLGLRSFSWIFVAALIGVTANQNAYFEGLYLSSSSVATAMINLVPAFTFVMAIIVGLEKVYIKSLRSMAKIVGTILCVGGAVCMALFKGSRLLNTQLFPPKSLLLGLRGGENLQLGCLFLFACCFCWSLWMIMQVPVSASCPDHLYLTFLTCFLATIQSAIFTFFVEDDIEVWHLHSFLEIGSCLYAGIVAAVSVLVQAWCVSLRGPLFFAMFNPLCTVITTIIASLFQHEKLYTGSLLGAFGVILGLYVVLWGKSKDFADTKKDKVIPNEQYHDDIKTIRVLIDQSSEKTTSCKSDLEESLLQEKST